MTTLAARTPEQRRADVRDGIRTGLRYALTFSIIATVAIVVGTRQGAPGQALLIWLVAVFFYVLAGTFGGALYGWLRPARNVLWGRLLTAYLILFLVYGGGSIAFYPLFVSADQDLAKVPILLLVAVWALLCLVLAPVYVLLFWLKNRV